MTFEKRTVISNDKLNELINYFESNALKKDIEKQVIYDFHSDHDFRLIRTKKYVKLDLKTSKVTDSDNTVYITKQYEKDLIEMLAKIGVRVEFKRFRTRYKYIYNNFFITIDENYKTGNIFRVKVSFETEEELEKRQVEINDLLTKLNIEETSFDKFNEIYGKYRSDWDTLTKDIDEEEYLNN